MWLTGADLKRMVEDAKAIYAYGKAQGGEPEEAMHYFMEALTGIRANKALYEPRAETPPVARGNGAPVWSVFPVVMDAREED